MKIKLILPLLISVSAFAGNPDFTESEVISILKKAFPDSGNILVKYNPKYDLWVFELNSPNQCLGCGEGSIQDDKQNPKIKIFPEG